MQGAEINKLSYDNANSYYIEFAGWQYVYNGIYGKIFENEEDIIISLSENNGFIAKDNLSGTQEIVFEAVWQEVEYDFNLRLNGGSYLENSANFEYFYDSAVEDFTIKFKAKFRKSPKTVGLFMFVMHFILIAGHIF